MQIPKAGPPPKITPTIRFVKDTFKLQRPNKHVEENVLAFRTHQNVTKPEIRQYFEKLYGIKAKKVDTVRFMGKTYRTHTGRYKHSAAFKKVYLKLADKVDPFLSKVE